MNIRSRLIRFAERCAVPAAAAFALIAAILSLPAHAFEVTVVKDAEFKPYQEAIRGFKSTCSCNVTEAELSDEDGVDAVLRAKTDAIVAVGANAFRKVRSVRGVPVLYLMVMPSETTALPDNVSGVSMNIAPDVYISSIADLFPRARRIGILYDPAHTDDFIRKATATARERKLELAVRAVGSPREVPALLDGMRMGMDVLLMLPDPTVVNSETLDYLLLFSFQNNIPIFSFSRKYVDRGAVAALQASPFDMGAQAGEMARSLSNNGKGPVRSYADRYHLIVNRKVAEKMGLRLDPDILKKAD